MAKLYYDKDVDPNRIKAKKVAVIGYGSQGHAHALNLHNSGVEVMVGLREGSSSKAKAEENGVKTGSVAEATKWADVIMILTPDTRQAQMYRDEVEPNLEAGNTLMFAHGFNVRFGEITPPANIDVSLVAPKAPGHRVREVYVDGGGVPNLVAVHQDVSGNALEDALSYSWGIGGTRAGTLITTFAEETETDLFGEQAVLCGGVSALVKAGFETLVNAGYQPEVAYFECMHELKLIVDLFYRGGLNFMRYSVSDTAEHGDYHAGDRIVTAETKAEMALILKEIQEGKYAKTWIGENLDGRPVFNARRVSEQTHQIEKVGAELRSMMPFIDPVVVKPEDQAN